MSATPDSPNPASDRSEAATDEAAAQLAQMRAAVADDVANLLARLPDDAGLLELTMAEGVDPAGLEQLLASLPDTDDLSALSAALNDPEALAHLLASRDAEPQPPEDTP